jgi:hypothetical protein
MSTSFIVIAFLAILVISGVFSMFGKGGGSLYTPVLVMLGLEVGAAISTALFLNLVTAFVATIVFARNKLVDYKFSLIFLPGTVVGSLIGAMLSNRAPKELLLGIFSVFLFAAGILMIRAAKEKAGQTLRSFTPGVTALVIAMSFGVGVLSSLIGVGGGLIIFPFLILYMRYPAQMGAGVNALIVTVSSLVGAAGHFALGPVDYRLIGITAIACVIGSTVGSYVTVKASPKFVKIAFAFIMWFFASEIALRLLGVFHGS